MERSGKYKLLNYIRIISILIHNIVVQLNPILSDVCLYDGTNYTVVIQNSTGIVLEEVVNSDSCNRGFCTANFPLLNMYSTITVTISASSIFGQSNATMITVDCIRLSTSNQVLLSLGVILLCIAILGILIVAIVCHSKKGTK